MTDEKRAKLEAIEKCDPSWLLMDIKQNSVFDAAVLEKVFDLAKDQARALLAAGASEGQADHLLDIRAYIVTDRSSGAKALKWAAELGNRFPSELYQLIPLTHHADAVAEIAALRERIAGMKKDAEQRHDKIRQIVCDWFNTSSYLKYALTDIDAALVKERRP